MSQSTIRIMCPSLVCRKVLAVPVSARGKIVRCRNCGTNIRVPDDPSAKAPNQQAAPTSPSGGRKG